MHQAAMSPLTIIHVALSLVGLVAGLIALIGFYFGRFYRLWTATFLITTIATCLTGFLFPFNGITPGIVIGIISLIVLAAAILAYRRRWTRTFVVACAIAEFFNVLVFIVQSFQKISVLHLYAPNGHEPIIAITQALALVFFIVLATLDIRRRRFTLN